MRGAFPVTDVQLCVVHQIRNATKFVSYKDRKAFCADMRPIYTAPTIEAAELALERFAHAWGTRYPMSVESWRRHWEGLTAFSKYPIEFRRLIYTTNAIVDGLSCRQHLVTAKTLSRPTDQCRN